MVPTNVLHAFAGRLHQFRFCSFPEYSAGYDVTQHVVGADGERSRQRRRSATDAAYPLRVHIGPANIVHHRHIRRCVLHSTAACFAISLRGNCYRWERCHHAGGAVVQLCREIPVCWPQCFSTELFCGLRHNPIRIQRLFLPTFSGKAEKVGLRSNRCGVTATTAVPVPTGNVGPTESSAPTRRHAESSVKQHLRPCRKFGVSGANRKIPVNTAVHVDKTVFLG